MMLSRYFILFLIVFIFKCQPPTWEVKLETKKESIQIINKFTSDKKIDFIFDRKAFSYLCYYGENINIDGNLSEINFKFNQIVLENEIGERRLYSNVFFEDDEIKDLPDENCMFDWYEYLTLSERPTEIIINIPYLSDLKVTKDDKKVRMFYVFNPTIDQAQCGYTKIVLKSNWINLR